MTRSLADYLNQTNGGGHLEHSVNFLVAAWSGYKPPEDMDVDMITAGIDATTLETAKVQLAETPGLLDEATLNIMSAAWDDPELHDTAVESLEEAANRLPVIEIGLIVTGTMYGLWLLTTRGRRATTRTTRRNDDGSFEETETTEWYDPTGPLRVLIDSIRPTNTNVIPPSTPIESHETES